MMSCAGGWCNPSWEAVSSCGCACAVGRQNKDWSSQTQVEELEKAYCIRKSVTLWMAGRWIIIEKKRGEETERRLGRRASQTGTTQPSCPSQHGAQTYFHLINPLHLSGLLCIRCHKMPCPELNQRMTDITPCLKPSIQHLVGCNLLLSLFCRYFLFYLCSFFCFSSLSLGGVSYLRCLLGAVMIFLVEVCSCFTPSVTYLPMQGRFYKIL